MTVVVIPLFWKSDSTHPVQLNGSLEFGRFRLDELKLIGQDNNGQVYPLEPAVEIIESDGFLTNHSGSTWKFQQVADDSLVISTSFLVAEVASFLGLGINADAALSARLTLRIPPTGSLPESFGTVDLCAHVDVDGAGVTFCPDPICLSINLPKIPSAPVSEGSPELWFNLPDIGIPVPRLPVPWRFPKIPLPVRWSAYSVNLRGIDIRVGWESLLLNVSGDGLKLVFERFQVDGLAGSLEADIIIAINRGGVDVPNSSIQLRRGPSIPLTGWHVGDGCFSLKWTGRQFGELLSLIAPGVSSSSLSADAEIALRVLTFADAVSEIRIDVSPTSASTLPIELPGFKVSLPGGKQFSLIYLAATGSGTAPAIDTVLAMMSLAAGQSVVAESTFTWTRSDDRELQNEGSGELTNKDPLIKITATKTDQDRTMSLLELPIGRRPRLLRQYDTLIPSLWNGAAAQYDATPWQTRSFDSVQWAIDFDFNDQLVDKFKMPFLNGETNGIGQYIKIKEPKFNSPDLSNSTVGGSVQVEVAVGPLKLLGQIGLSFNWESFAFNVDHGEGLDFVIDDVHEFSFLGMLWTFKNRPDGGPFFKLVTANSDYKLIQMEGSEIELRFNRATTEDQPIVFSVANFEITEAGISLNAKVTEQPAKLNGLETEFRFKEGTFQIKENRILGFSIAGGGPLPPDLIGEANADIRLQFEQVGDSLELIRGSAKVSGNKLAHCKGTRFELSLDALGLEFVNDGAYHLYFLITGSAEYKPLAGDDSTGLLSYMPGIQIKLVDCPLTGNARVIAQHVEFKVKLPESVGFELFGCFAMELRGFGFSPQCDKFGGDGALILAGQVKFASGGGDVVSAQFDFHDLYVGLPKKGSLIPRFYMKGLGVAVKIGTSKVFGSVELIQDEEVAPGLIGNGFRGTGGIEINGLPPMSATYAFLRVIRPQDGREVLAWFIYLEARRMSFKVPVIEVYLREVGLGLGYRYTLVSIKRADEVDDVKQLIKELKVLSRTQANLAEHSSWTVDVEPPGQKPKLTVALRALITQTSAAKGPFDWNEEKEEHLACLFLLDAVVALRSDLTFFMVARGWLNTNYSDFNKSVEGKKTLHTNPLISGFVLLSPRQKRFLAHVASNPGGEFGDHPPTPPFLKNAIKQSQFSATLLIEPGLVHAELGWPNMLRWGDKLGPLEVEFRGGAIFRTSTDELVTGLSYLATGSVSFEATASAGIVGITVSGKANVAFGARYIGVLDFQNISRSAFYGAIGLEIKVRASVQGWAKFKKWGLKIEKSIGFDFDLSFTASLELGLLGDGSVGTRGSGTFMVNTPFRSVHVTAFFKFNDGAVSTARRITERFLSMGLEATEVDTLPGVENNFAFAGPSPLPESLVSSVELLASGNEPSVRCRVTDNQASRLENEDAPILPELPAEFLAPDYILFQKPSLGSLYFILLPDGGPTPVAVAEDDLRAGMVRDGFYAVPPKSGIEVSHDYVWEIPNFWEIPDEEQSAVIQWFDPGEPESEGRWKLLTLDSDRRFSWKMGWTQKFEEDVSAQSDSGDEEKLDMTVERVLRTAFVAEDDTEQDDTDAFDESPPEVALDNLVLIRDPVQWPELPSEFDTEDERLKNPSDLAFEPAVRAAQEQFESAPYFRHDVKRSHYDDMLTLAFDRRNEIYSDAPPMRTNDARIVIDEPTRSEKDQQAIQMRGMLLQQMMVDFRSAVSAVKIAERGGATEPNWKAGLPGKAGMLFRVVAAWQSPVQAAFLDRDMVSEMNAAGNGDPVAIGEIERRFASQIGFPLGRGISVHIGSGAEWIVSGSVAVYRVIDDGEIVLIARPVSLPSLEQLRETEGTAWGTIWQRKGVDKDRPDTTVDGKSVTLFNDISRSFATRDASIEEAKTFEHENTIAIGWKLKWNGDDSELLEKSLAYYAVTRRRLDDANSEIHFAVREMDPLVRVELTDEQKKKTNNAAYGIQRIRSRFPIVDHFSPEPSGALTREIQYIYSITPVSHDGIRGRTGTVVATRRPSVPPRVPTDGRLEILFPCDSRDLFCPQREARVHQPSRMLVRWSEPTVPAGEPRIGISKLRLVFRRNRTLPTGLYGVDSDARGNVQTGVSATNARKLRTDITFEWDAAVGNNVRVAEVNGQAVYYLVLDIDELRENGVVPREGATWCPEAWEIYLQAESANEVRSSLAAVQIALQFAPEKKIKEILEWQKEEKKRSLLLAENERNVENREVGQLEWFAKPVVMPPLPPNDSDRETGWALVPQPIEADGIIGKFPKNAAGYQLHPDRVRAIRFLLNQGPSGQHATPLDLHAGFRIVSFDALAHDPERLVPNPDNRTWNAFTEQAQLKTVQEIELVPAEALAMSPADTFTPRIWEVWYPSERRRIALSLANTNQKLTGDKKKRAPWFSWRESILVWPDPLTSVDGNVNPNALFHRDKATTPIRWRRGRHALLDEIVTRVQFEVIDSLELAEEFPTEWGVNREELRQELDITNDSGLGEAPVLLNRVIVGLKGPERLKYPELQVLPQGTFITVTEPQRRWRALLPSGTSIRIERLVKTGGERWRILIPIGMPSNPNQVPALEVINQPWDASENLSAALNACEPVSDPYGWNALQRLGLSVTFTLRLPDQGKLLPATEMMARLKRAIADACQQEPFDKDFKEHIHVEMLYRSDRRLKVGTNKPSSRVDTSEVDLMSMIQVSLRPKIVKKLQYDVWTVEPIGMDISSLRGKSLALLIELTTTSNCHLVVQPGTPGAEVSIPSGSGNNAARISVTIPAEGSLRLLFRGTHGEMPTRILSADPDFPITIKRTKKDVPPWDPSSAHFNWTQEHEWLDDRFRQYIQALGATNEQYADETLRFDLAKLEPSEKKRIQNEIQDWGTRFFDYGGDVYVDESESAFGSGTRTDSSWFATAYPRTYSPALAAPDADHKIIYDHFVDDRWESAYRHLVVPDGRYDKLWEFVAGSTVLFSETAQRNLNNRTLDALPSLPDGGLDVCFPRIQPVSAPLVQLSSRLDEPSTPGRPAPPGPVWEVILERHPEQVLKESNHHLQARLNFHDVIWTRFRRFRFSDELIALQDVFFQRHLSWKVPSPNDTFLKLPDDGNPRFTFAVDGTTLIDDQEVARNLSQIWRIRDRVIAALPESEREIIHVRIVTAADGQLLLLFVAQEDRDIRLVDGTDPSRVLKVIENETLHTISVRHVENQLDDSIALPLAPVHPDKNEVWNAQDWVERQGRIPIEDLSSDVRRMIDLPLRQNRIQGGAMVYQFDGHPYFYAQRLFFAARAGTEHSVLTRLDHSDFHYVSPIPETNAEGLERDGDRFRQIEITLSRYWDCLGSTARNRWPSEMPNEPATSLSVSTISVMVGGQFGSVHRYDPVAKSLSAPIAIHEGRVVDLLIKDLPNRLYSIGHDRTLQRWDLESDPPESTNTLEFHDSPRSMASSIGKIAVGDSSGRLHVRDEDDLAEVGSRLVLTRDISAVIGMPNGDWLVGGLDGTITRVKADLSTQSVWDAVHDQKVTAFAISYDGSKLCSVAEDALLVVWDIATETATLKIQHVGPSNDDPSVMVPVPLTGVAISDDGSVVAIAGQDGNVFAGSIDTFDSPEQIGDHASGKTCVQFVSDLGEFLSAGQDGTIQQMGTTVGSLDAGTFSSLPDTAVVYQYTLVKPGRVIETISEIRFDSLQPHGYLARDIAVGYKTSVVKLRPPTPGDPRMRLTTTLERDVKASASTSFATAGTSSQASLTFEAKDSGASGSRIRITFLKAPLGSGISPEVSVSDRQITVTLNTTPGSESTVAKIVEAIGADTASLAIVTVTRAGSASQDATYKLTPWTVSLGVDSAQWISSRHSFDETELPSGITFTTPHACRLRWAGALSILRKDEPKLRQQIDELIAPTTGFGVDASFREALLLLRKQVPDSVNEVVIPAPTDKSVRDRLFRSGRISLELVTFLSERGVSTKLRSWLENVGNGDTWLAHSGNRTHRLEVTTNTITVYQTIRDNIAEASIGLEQLSELPAFRDVYQLNPTPKYRTTLARDQWALKWLGAMSQTQFEILKREENGDTKGWTVTSDFRTSLFALLEALAAGTVVIGFDGAHPTEAEIPQILRDRIKISDTADGSATEHHVSWVGFVLHRKTLDGTVLGSDDDVLQALDDLHALGSGEQGFKDAIDALRKKLAGDESERETVAIPIVDGQWFPRPNDDDLMTHFPVLAKHLMVRSGVISFAGVMTQDEAKILFEQAKTDFPLATSPDQRACEEMFADAFNSGLDGARIEVRTRRGSAGMMSREVEAIVPRKDEGS